MPGTFAAADEIAALLEVMAEERRGVLQVVPAGIGGHDGPRPRGAMDPELEWMLALRRAAPATR